MTIEQSQNETAPAPSAAIRVNAMVPPFVMDGEPVEPIRTVLDLYDKMPIKEAPLVLLVDPTDHHIKELNSTLDDGDTKVDEDYIIEWMGLIPPWVFEALQKADANGLSGSERDAFVRNEVESAYGFPCSYDSKHHVDSAWRLCYPGDEPLYPIGAIVHKDYVFLEYPYGYVAFNPIPGQTPAVTRMD